MRMTPSPPILMRTAEFATPPRPRSSDAAESGDFPHRARCFERARRRLRQLVLVVACRFGPELTSMGQAPTIPLPCCWPRQVRRAFLHAIALARAALVAVRAGFENSPLERARLIANATFWQTEALLLKEE